MTFYLEPPTGGISLKNLEEFAEKRLDFLLKVYHSRNDQKKLLEIVEDAVNVRDSECLIAGSKKDAISHFIVRLALCSEKDGTDFIMNAETSLFKFHLFCMNEDELRQLFRKTEKSLDSAHKPSTKVACAINLFKALKTAAKTWKNVVKLCLAGDSSYFHVPFYLVFNLIAKRQVTLSSGFATVPFSKLKEVVAECFKSLMMEGILHAREKMPFVQTDIRMKKLFHKLHMQLRRNLPSVDQYCVYKKVSHEDVSSEAKWFPPCMYNLNKALRQKHRLKHHSRIQFTLFLKEIGMPVHEALQFWKREYFIPVHDQDGCCHDWKDHEDRYVYNIRHLYGLEGSNINYRAHCCASLQNFLPSTGEVGGCPFKHFDTHHLDILLKDFGISDIEKRNVDELVKKEKYSEACSNVLKNKLQIGIDHYNCQIDQPRNDRCLNNCSKERAFQNNIDSHTQISKCVHCHKKISNTYQFEMIEQPVDKAGLLLRSDNENCMKKICVQRNMENTTDLIYNNWNDRKQCQCILGGIVKVGDAKNDASYSDLDKSGIPKENCECFNKFDELSTHLDIPTKKFVNIATILQKPSDFYFILRKYQTQS